jgi:hypothetical protein
MIPQIQADPVARHEQAARRARDDQDRNRAYGHWSGVLAAVDRERRHLEQAAGMLDEAAALATAIGDRSGARAYRARAISLRGWASVL